jgi:hypothetical protein
MVRRPARDDKDRRPALGPAAARRNGPELPLDGWKTTSWPSSRAGLVLSNPGATTGRLSQWLAIGRRRRLPGILGLARRGQQ